MSYGELVEKKISRQTIYEGKILNVVCDKVLLPNGNESIREFCIHVGGVCIIPITDDGCVLMEHQYRYPHGRVFFEIPAGKLNYKGECIEDAARRELLEETGAVAGKLTYLGTIDTTPALINEKLHLYLAEQLSFKDASPDDDEFLTVEAVPLKTLYDDVMAGRICDAKTQIAVLKVMALRAEGQEH